MCDTEKLDFNWKPSNLHKIQESSIKYKTVIV